MFVGVDTGNMESKTSILVHECVGINGEVRLEPVILSKGQVSELIFGEYEEVK